MVPPMLSIAADAPSPARRGSSAESSSTIPYRELWVDEPVPARFAGLLRTPFRIAERGTSPAGLVKPSRLAQAAGVNEQDGPDGPDGPDGLSGSSRLATSPALAGPSDRQVLIIFPGFGVSASQLQVDELLWQGSRRYSCLITHAAINYRTSHEFLLWQYAQLLRRLAGRSICMLGISLGGTTAVQLLFALRDAPAQYRRFTKLVTLLSAVTPADFTPRWQDNLRLIRELRGDDRPAGELARLIRGSVLRVVARAIRKNVQRSCIEADSCDEIIASFSHFAQAYAPCTQALPTGALPGIDLVSVGLSCDGMVAQARAHRYAADGGRHVVLSGEHTPSFYSRSKDEFDKLLLRELG